MGDEYTIAMWTSHPFTAHDKRDRSVDHRVRVLVYDTGFVDVLHERRLNHTDSGWSTVHVVEVRDSGVRYERHREGVMSE